MAQHTATVSWKRDGQHFVDNRYSRRHSARLDGGLEIPMSSSPHVVPVPLSDASAADPEELFVAAVASCHMLWFLSIAAARGFCVDSYTDEAVGTMAKNDKGKQYIARVTLRPNVTFSGERIPTSAELDAMHHKAHERCFIASSILSEVVCEPVISSS